jgi:CD109 antigen
LVNIRYISGNQFVMRFKLRIWSWIFVIASCATAQDININNNNPNLQYDINNPYSTITPNSYDVNNGPYTQDPTYGDRYGNDQFGRDNVNNRPDQYDPNSGQYNPYPGQFDPQTGLYDQYGKPDQFGGRGGTPNTPWKQNPFGFGTGRNEIDASGSIIREGTYFIVASKVVRPGHLYRVAVTILQEDEPLTVRASITRDGVEMSADHKKVKKGVPETLLMRVPSTSVYGDYKLRVEGLYDDVLGGVYFVNETNLIFSQRSMTIFIQLDKPVYMQGEKIRFRTIPINTELKAFNEAVDVYMLDPNGHIMKRWLSKQSNLGTVSLDYQLSDQPVFGEWKVRVIAQNQIEESSFLVEEYYQTRFEVNVTMPAFFLNTHEYIHGVVMANYTSGAPVRGNLTLKAIIRPIKPIDPKRVQHKNKNRIRNRFNTNNRFYNRYNDRQYNQPNYNQHNYNEYDNQYSDYDTTSDYNRPIVEKYFNFDEKLPFWFNIPENSYEPVPNLKFFYGVYAFKYPIRELLHYAPTLEGMEVVVVATVGERFLDEVIEGYSTARIFNSSIQLSFIGGSPQVYKPGMPVTTYIAASFHDGSSLPHERLTNGVMEVFAYIESPNGRRDLPSRQLYMMHETPGVWEYKFDMKSELGVDGNRPFENANTGGSIRIQARFRDGLGQHAETELLLLSHHSPDDHHIKVFTSTLNPQVGNNMIFHIKSNFFIRKFSYMIVAKGIVLVTSDQDMSDYISTMAVPLSAEMAPVATIVVWHLGLYGEVTVDSLTFPVNGISRNKVTN